MRNNSSLSELENLFSQNICVRDIAESLVSFDAEQSAEKVKEIMKANSYNVVGVRYNGEIKEYVESRKLRSGNIGEYSKPINHELNSSDSIKDLLYNLLENEYFFIKVFNKYGAIVTRSDLQKISFRLWFYGMIAILELNLLNLIRKIYPKDEWFNELNENEKDRIRKLYELRSKKDVLIDLAECSEFPHKLKVITIKNKKFREKFRLGKDEIDSLNHKLKDLRNDIAHSADIGSWQIKDLITIIEYIEDMISIINEYYSEID